MTLGTFDMLDMFDHAKIEPGEIYRKVKEITTPKAEAVFVACTQLRALEVLDSLERDLGKPVYSAVQASAWAGLPGDGRRSAHHRLRQPAAASCRSPARSATQQLGDRAAQALRVRG